MDSELDLLTPVEGVAGLICRGFSMREIAALLALRATVRPQRLRSAQRAPVATGFGVVAACLRRQRNARIWPKS